MCQKTNIIKVKLFTYYSGKYTTNTLNKIIFTIQHFNNYFLFFPQFLFFEDADLMALLSLGAVHYFGGG